LIDDELSQINVVGMIIGRDPSVFLEFDHIKLTDG